jgi:hypothetical protein
MKQKQTPQKGHQGIPALKTAASDEKNLKAGFKRITFSKHELGR